MKQSLPTRGKARKTWAGWEWVKVIKRIARTAQVCWCFLFLRVYNKEREEEVVMCFGLLTIFVVQKYNINLAFQTWKSTNTPNKRMCSVRATTKKERENKHANLNPKPKRESIQEKLWSFNRKSVEGNWPTIGKHSYKIVFVCVWGWWEEEKEISLAKKTPNPLQKESRNPTPYACCWLLMSSYLIGVSNATQRCKQGPSSGRVQIHVLLQHLLSLEPGGFQRQVRWNHSNNVFQFRNKKPCSTSKI